ncbi:DeoR/GlpR family transcriptional regulator of sugar metabolism [Kibdelosporangium banguiense]|uniref:DeoR/GlpR family transcriptional regulator of sugar metabolism n=1 Tax=Kibdelosporangium banguiense TaxID=1365924 RepID=A0ABS4TQ10_9PSEU|nr:DeoR/GlpR family DNA-binding transcription regulator [Kibdelosporangium banguiense]MBP2326492.1 DeoR/GlpR family transcriptional regulator of sugar metabolism [Kibdelosporangium banguiense]
MIPEGRRELILRTLRTDGPAEVRALAEQFGVSQATIRRDLVQLDKEGRLSRVHGGAVSAADTDDPFAEVARVRVDEKDAIAEHGAGLIKDGEAVLLDIGTTALRLARKLHGRSLTVITSNLAVYEELKNDNDIQIVLLGGILRRSYQSLVGFLTEDNLRQVHADRLFLGTSGIRAGGQIVDTTAVEVPLKRAMIAASDQVVLLADASKFPGTGMARVCDPGDIDVVITNAGADPVTCAALRQADVEVIEV